VISCLEGLTHKVEGLAGGGSLKFAWISSSEITLSDGVHKATFEGAAVAGAELVHARVNEDDVPAEHLPWIP